MDFDARKPVFPASDQVQLKPVCSAMEKIARSLKLCILLVELLYYPESITKALIGLCGWAGWSGALLFACNKVRFSCVFISTI